MSDTRAGYSEKKTRVENDQKEKTEIVGGKAMKKTTKKAKKDKKRKKSKKGKKRSSLSSSSSDNSASEDSDKNVSTLRTFVANLSQFSTAQPLDNDRLRAIEIMQRRDKAEQEMRAAEEQEHARQLEATARQHEKDVQQKRDEYSKLLPTKEMEGLSQKEEKARDITAGVDGEHTTIATAPLPDFSAQGLTIEEQLARWRAHAAAKPWMKNPDRLAVLAERVAKQEKTAEGATEVGMYGGYKEVPTGMWKCKSYHCADKCVLLLVYLIEVCLYTYVYYDRVPGLRRQVYSKVFLVSHCLYFLYLVRP